MKDEAALKTIGEISKILKVPQHVLRFWEKKFKNIRPIQKENGRRYYSNLDLENLLKIKKLLYDNHYSIKGVQQKLFQKNKSSQTNDITSLIIEIKNIQQKLKKIIYNGV